MCVHFQKPLVHTHTHMLPRHQHEACNEGIKHGSWNESRRNL